MSVLSVNRLCRDIERDPMMGQAFLDNPEAELLKYPRGFTDDERVQRFVPAIS